MLEMRKGLLIPLTMLLATPVMAEPAGELKRQVEAVLALAPAGTRFGLLVVDAQGREVVAIDPDKRFMPASNTKLFTTAAALALLGDPATPNGGGERTSFSLIKRRKGPPDVLLVGRGAAIVDAMPDCVANCLSSAVQAIAARTRQVNDIIADDTWFPDQRWSPGMSWNNIGTDDGTAVSALIVNDNQLPVTITPGAVGKPPQVALSPYLTLVNDAVVTTAGKPDLRFELAVNGRVARLYGSIAVDALPDHRTLGIDDPADFAAWLVRQALAAQGVRVLGTTRVRHRPANYQDDTGIRAGADGAVREQGASPDLVSVAVAEPLSLNEDVVTINKRSQNLHADLLLRRIGRIAGSGSIADGIAREVALFTAIGIPRIGYDFSDGSGMSTYNRVSPRALIALLRWGQGQSWGPFWRSSFPIAARDGTLKRRFAGTPLAGKLWAKTGTLNATNALSGYLQSASGNELTFSFFANDVPSEGNALAAMDAALTLIAASN